MLGKESLLNKLADKTCFKCLWYTLSVCLTFFKTRLHDKDLDEVVYLEGNFRKHGEGQGKYKGKTGNPQKGSSGVGYHSG